MIISWGRRSVKLSDGAHHHCQKCDEEKPFSIFLQYKVFGLFWIFLTSWSKLYTYCCNVCGKGWELQGEAKAEAEDAVSRLGKSPIPFLHRFGLWMFLCVVMPMGWYMNYSDDKNMKEINGFTQGAGIEWDTLNQEVLRLYRAGEYERAIIVAQATLKVAEDNVGPNHPDVAESLNNLALLYKTQGNYAKAEPLYKRALSIREKAFGPNHPSVATLLNNLAELYKATNRSEETKKLEERAARIKAIKR